MKREQAPVAWRSYASLTDPALEVEQDNHEGNPSPRARPAEAGYRLDVDGLRAVAVVAVIIYHLNKAWLPGGFIGVDIFFVISGFVVTGSLLRRQAQTLGALTLGSLRGALTLTLVSSLRRGKSVIARTRR